MKKTRILTFLLAFSMMGVTSCVKYNGVPQVKEEESSAITVTLSASSMDLKVGDGGKTFTATLASEEVQIEDKKVAIASDNEEIAVTDVKEAEDGANIRVKGLKEGSANITVTSKQDPTGKAVLKVKVTSGDGTFAVESVSVKDESVTLLEGETSQIEWTVLPENATVKDVEFSTSDANVATVNSTGLITAVKKGTAEIAVTTKSGGKKASVAVTVNEDTTLVENAYYLMGGDEASDSTVWTTPKKSREFTLNEGGGSGKEYFVTFECSAGESFKAVQYKGTNPLIWLEIYDFGGSNHSGAKDGCATVDGGNLKIASAGKYTIYLDIGIHDDTDTNCVKYWIQQAVN
ncbi:MAG: Ig-like domain-containing protein [Bacilli bacterium]|nr:Ig-like domain-containing protein [Bacilli bacterium]